MIEQKYMTPEALSAIAACASAIVAVCALFFTWWQCREAQAQRCETERQNRMGVRPLLAFTRALLNLENHPVGIFITNSGLGPAVVRQISVIDKVSRKIVIGEKALQEIFLPIIQQLGMDVQHFWLDRGSGIRVGETIKLLWVKSDSKYQQQMIMLMNRINIKLEYESMYEEECNPVYLHGTDDFSKPSSPGHG